MESVTRVELVPRKQTLPVLATIHYTDKMVRRE